MFRIVCIDVALRCVVRRAWCPLAWRSCLGRKTNKRTKKKGRSRETKHLCGQVYTFLRTCLCTCPHTCLRARCTHVNTWACVRARMFACPLTAMQCMPIHMPVHMSIHMSLRKSIHTCLCLCLCTHAHACLPTTALTKAITIKVVPTPIPGGGGVQRACFLKNIIRANHPLGSQRGLVACLCHLLYLLRQGPTATPGAVKKKLGYSMPATTATVLTERRG